MHKLLGFGQGHKPCVPAFIGEIQAIYFPQVTLHFPIDLHSFSESAFLASSYLMYALQKRTSPMIVSAVKTAHDRTLSMMLSPFAYKNTGHTAITNCGTAGFMFG
jgi:hypothetical protein